MPIKLSFQSTGLVPGTPQPLVMRGTSMTLGRSDQNDVVLPDPDKVISGRHCAIEDHGGNVIVIDFSTNGTFLNYGKVALGATPTPLHDGDILSIGSYELLVEIRTEQVPDRPAALPVAPGENRSALDVLDEGDDFLDDLLGGPASGPAKPSQAPWDDEGLLPPLEDDDLLSPTRGDADAGGPSQSEGSSPLTDMIQTSRPASGEIPDDWDLDLPGAAHVTDASQDASPEAAALPEFSPDDLLGPDIPEGPAPPPEPKPTPVAQVEEQPVPDPVRRTTQIPAPDTSPVAQPHPGPDRAMEAFMRGLGAESITLPPKEVEATFERLGHVLRTMIHGVREILMTRASIKSEFRIHQTVISAGKNNPLKFSVSPAQAVESMIRPTTEGYLDAATATEEALNDIKAHEVAMMTGMEAALKGVLAKLEPAKLATLIEADSGFRAVLTNKKARYWDTFEKKYEEISDQAENDFHDLFSKEFARAYQEQLKKLK
jgi:type VI secretion system FHA domain protein